MTNELPGRRRATWAGAAALATVLAVAIGVAWLFSTGDSRQHRAILFSACVCGFAALSGWFVTRSSRERGAAAAVAGGLGGTLVRLAPLVAALGWLSTQQGGLGDAGAANYLVAFYLPLLATDITLTILTTPKGRRNGGADAAI